MAKRYIILIVFAYLFATLIANSQNRCDTNTVVFGSPEELPKIKDITKFIADNLDYPEAAKKDKIEGSVYVSFWIDTLGYTFEHKITKGVRLDLNEEALRVARLIRFDKPAMNRGKPIEIKSGIPVKFKLNNLDNPQLSDKVHYVGDNKLSKEIVADVKIVIEDFEQIPEGGKEEKFILIDLVEKKEHNEIYIVATRYVFEIMFKRPDCLLKCNDRIVYLYTKDYIHVNDSIWLNKVLTETHIVLGAPNFKVSWSNDSVIGPIANTGDLNKMIVATHYDPVAYKYIIKDGEIHSKEVAMRLYYPDNRYPKGIHSIKNIHSMRGYPYWSTNDK